MDDASRLERIEKQLKVLPQRPGVYIIYDISDEVIYVGKAKVLANRVRSHFAKSTDFSKSRVIREQGARIEVHEVSTENEALLLEYNMIQEHQPPLNTRYTDGKTYPYLEVTTGEQWPRFIVTRDRTSQDSVFLGPFSDVGAVKRSLRYVLKLFPVADCQKEIHLGDAQDWAKTCIRRRTRQCMRPCEIDVDADEYQDNVQQVIHFMEGKLPQVVADVESKMIDASKSLEFEKAAKYRDVIKSIQRTMQRQQVFLEGVEDNYVLVESANSSEINFSLQKTEDNRIVRRDNLMIEKEDSEAPTNIIEQCLDFVSSILQLDKSSTPPLLIIDGQYSDALLSALSSYHVRARVSNSDLDRQLITMAKHHSDNQLQRRLLVQRDRRLPSRKVEDLGKLLGLELPPYTIDTFDVSTLMGTNNVASCVRFLNGKPLKKGYRRFKIMTVEQQDDFASMYEAVSRRYREITDGIDQKGLPIPDLVVIDGGAEQLKRAKKALDEHNLDIPVIGLAKREEEIYLPDVETPLNEDNSRPGMLLLMAGRDEAHRFAVSYQRTLRQKEGLKSILDDIPGVGPKRKSKLLKTYKTVSSVAKESSETLSSKIGISSKLASEIIAACRSFTTQQGRRRR
ncbi:MAG: excinuclease ABC subunit UvrC [Candidatus Kariarchaeaceae archaeon]|jgi:excinuclease ABC subunit C